MTELEIIEAVSALVANAMTAFTVYFSFTFAYLTVCYLAGATLSRFQAVAVSTLYVISAATAGLTVIGNQRGVAEIQESHPSVIVDRMLIFDIDIWHIAASTMFVAIAMLSLYFMYDCRNRG